MWNWFVRFWTGAHSREDQQNRCMWKCRLELEPYISNSWKNIGIRVEFAATFLCHLFPDMIITHIDGVANTFRVKGVCKLWSAERKSGVYPSIREPGSSNSVEIPEKYVRIYTLGNRCSLEEGFLTSPNINIIIIARITSKLCNLIWLKIKSLNTNEFAHG